MKNMNNHPASQILIGRARSVSGILVLVFCFFSQLVWAQSLGQRHFVTPEDGVNALVEAVESHDMSKLKEILGPDGNRVISSGDEVADKNGREAFVRAYKERHQLVIDKGGQATLVIGRNEWPLPIPLVKSNRGWYFDTDKGDDEILARRIGRNEITAVKVMLEIVDAQREYAALNRSEDGLPVYAAKIISTPGKRDGLYWPADDDEPLSPIGELLAAAAAEGYAGSDALQRAPYHGYLYRILDRQGVEAKGGAQHYVANGRMTNGFAVVAWPARYGASGVMTFIVNHEGQVFQKNLGENTDTAVAAIDSFNPDPSWKPVDSASP